MNRHSVTAPIRPLDDFVCTAVHLTDVPQIKPRYSGRNPDLIVRQEIVLDATNSVKSSVCLDNSVESMIRQLAEFVTKSADPGAASATVQQRLLVEIKEMHRANGA